MSKLEDDFGSELAHAAEQLHHLAQIARTTGLRKPSECRELLVQIQRLGVDTAALVEGRPTQDEVDALTARYRAVMPLLLDAMYAAGPPQ